MKLRKALNKPHDSCFHCSICPFTWSDMLSSSLHFVIIQCISGIICPKSYHTYAFLRIGSTSMPYTCRFQCIRKVASKIRMEGLGVVMMTSLFLNYFAKILGGCYIAPPSAPHRHPPCIVSYFLVIGPQLFIAKNSVTQHTNFPFYILVHIYGTLL